MLEMYFMFISLTLNTYVCLFYFKQLYCMAKGHAVSKLVTKSPAWKRVVIFHSIKSTHCNRNLFRLSQNLNIALKRLQCFPMWPALWKYCIPLSCNNKLVCDRKLDLKPSSQATTYFCRVSRVWHHWTQKVITALYGYTRIYPYIGILYCCRLALLTTCCYSYTSEALLVSRLKLRV